MQVATKDYEYADYPFEEFNPVQSKVIQHVESDHNVLVASPTASGKTICGEIIAGRTLHQGERVVYLSPLKALVEEKLRDWSDPEHPWSKHSLIAMTGDYHMTAARARELNKAEIIISTYEMLAVRARRESVENSSWVDEVGCLIVDEAHFIGSEGRGDHLENALLAFTSRNPAARVVFLSATMKNSKELGEWLSDLNDEGTVVVESEYRPCKLNLHWEVYPKIQGNPWKAYAENEECKIGTVLELVNEHAEDQWLIFVHSKAAGRKLLKALNEHFPGVCEFHNADAEKAKREAIETKFREGGIRFLVATSTLAYGLNLPARRVAILGVHRGMDEVDPMDVIQECGRAGRPRYDKEGDAYIVIDDDLYSSWRTMVEEGVPVESTLYRRLGFHLIGEIAEKRSPTVQDGEDWSKATFSHAQGKIPPPAIQELYDNFHKKGLTRFVKSDSRFVATQLGKIAAHHYFDPLDVVDWKMNMLHLRETETMMADAAIAWMYTSVHTNKGGYIPKELREWSADYISELRSFDVYPCGDQAATQGTILWMILRGEHEGLKLLPSFVSGLRMDSERVLSCIEQVDKRVLQGSSRKYWKLLAVRIKYGVDWEAAELCTIKGIGGAYAVSLIDHGICSIEDFIRYRKTAQKILPPKVYRKAALSVKEIWAARMLKKV